MQSKFKTETIYHIFNRANNYENLFIEEKNYDYFIELLKKHVVPIADIYAYCLLPNHFHLVLEIKNNKQLPKDYQIGRIKIHQAFSNMFNAYAKAINKAYGRRGSLFQKHLKRIIVDDNEYLQNLILYVHLNPEKHKIFYDFTLYTHSSYKPILSSEKTFLKREKVVELFDDRENFIFNHKDLTSFQNLLDL